MGASLVPSKGLVSHLAPVTSVLEATRGRVTSIIPFDRRVSQAQRVKLWAQALSSLEAEPRVHPRWLLQAPTNYHVVVTVVAVAREVLCQSEDTTLSLHICPFPYPVLML